MIVREEINGLIFIAQTTYYVYKNEEALQKNHSTLTTSDEELFNANKEHAKDHPDEYQKFIVF